MNIVIDTADRDEISRSNKTFKHKHLGVADCVNSRVSRRVETQGESYALEKELPQVFDLVLKQVLAESCESFTHFSMLKVLLEELENKEGAGVVLSSKTKGLLHRLRTRLRCH